MAIINFTKADVLKSQLLPKDWYSFQVVRVEGPTPSADKQSMNYNFICALIDNTPDLNGKELIVRGNSKWIAGMIPFIAATQGKTQAEIPKEDFAFDTEEVVGTKFDGAVIQKLYEGRLSNDFEQFLPYKKSANAPQWVG